MNSKNLVEKSLESTFKKIEFFSKSESFVISQSPNYLINNCNIYLVWKPDSNIIGFELDLLTSLNPTEINFEEIGLNTDFSISSQKQSLVIPAYSINYTKTKQFIDTEKIKGEISELYSKSLKLSEPKFFRSIININNQNITTIFTGRPYICEQTEYSHGLTALIINNTHIDIYRHKYNGQKVLVIESNNKVDFTLFKKISKSVMKGIALLTGNWYRDKYYIVSSGDNSFNKIDSVYYESIQESVITELGIIKPSEFVLYQEQINNKKVLLTSNLFPNNVFSKIIENILSNETINRAIQTIIEVSNNESDVIKSSMYYVSIETMIGLIYKENKVKLKPIKETKDLGNLLEDIASTIEKYKEKFTEKELEIINKKIKYLNTPFNADKPLRIFKFFKINLSEKYFSLIKNRNLFLHGSIPYNEDELKNSRLEIHLDTLRIRLLSTILILKYFNYNGHIKNLAGQILFDTNLYNKGIHELKEEIYYEI